MSAADNSILLIGESGVGKTHYGAQLLQRLMKGDGQLRMNGAATNLEPFEAALEALNEGRTADHTATSTYVDSVWPVENSEGHQVKLIWPDYGGEQVKAMINTRQVPKAWQERVSSAQAWLLLIRLQQTRASDDVFSRPLKELHEISIENGEVQVSDQARLIELLQVLSFVGAIKDCPLERPRLAVLLTCWDELGFDGTTPAKALESQLPMLAAFIRSNWHSSVIMGLSALERPLNPNERDRDYTHRGPEEFGYVVRPDGSRSSDLTMPVAQLLDYVR